MSEFGNPIAPAQTVDVRLYDGEFDQNVVVDRIIDVQEKPTFSQGITYEESMLLVSPAFNNKIVSASHNYTQDYFELRAQPGRDGEGGGSVTIVDDILDWNTDRYRPHISRQAGVLYNTDTTEPVSTNYLAYDGYLYSTRFYGDLYRPDGNLRHLRVQAGHALGAGSDGGNLTIKAGNAIIGDTGSVGGALYLAAGDNQDGVNAANIYIGTPSDVSAWRYIRGEGAGVSVSISITAKGQGNVQIGSYSPGGNVSVKGFQFVTSGSVTSFYRSNNTLTQLVLNGGDSSIIGLYPSASIVLKGGDGRDGVGILDGSNVYIYGGRGYGAGISGEIYFGNGSAGYLNARTTETNVVFYDPATGKLSYGIGSSGGGVDPTADYTTYEPIAGTVTFTRDPVTEDITNIETVNSIGTKSVDFTYTDGEVSQIDIDNYGVSQKRITFTKVDGEITEVLIVEI